MQQKTALDIMKAGRNVYLTGAAGTGKTYVLNQYIEYLKERGVPLAVTASTGIAATHIGGTTIHSWSGLGIHEALDEFELEMIGQKEYLWKRYEKNKVLIIDEVSMLSPVFFDSLNRLAQMYKQSGEPFGGMQIILSGDFFQLPPISKSSSSVSFIPGSEAWRTMDIRTCYLTEQFRTDDPHLTHVLNGIRRGNIDASLREILESRFLSNPKDEDLTRLFTHNVDVDALNEEKLSALSGTVFEHTAETKGRKALVESLFKSILAPEVVRLKKNARVMFVRNNPAEGYVNGTLGTVTGFSKENEPIVETFSGEKIYVQPVEWMIEQDGSIRALVRQLPLRLAWAITIHKSQGMSLDAAHIDLSKAFAPGQGYVALSRLRSMNGLTLAGLGAQAFTIHPESRDLDVHLRRDSEKWEQVVARFTEDRMGEMHRSFVDACGGTNDIKKIDEIKQKAKEPPKKKISTYEVTRDLIASGVESLEALAAKRGLTIGTVLSHIEDIAMRWPSVDLSSFAPPKRDLTIIAAAFKKSGDTKLSPVFAALKEKYSYEELRLARIFIEME